MPKILGQNLKENRNLQRQRILEAAESLLRETGIADLTLAKVAVRAEQPRSSVYHYFPSVPDLLIALVNDAFDHWVEVIHRHIDTSAEPLERIRQYFEGCIELALAGDADLATKLATIDLDARCRRHFEERHQQLGEPVVEAFREMKVVDAERSSKFTRAVFVQATLALHNGADPATVEAEVMTVATAIAKGFAVSSISSPG